MKKMFLIIFFSFFSINSYPVEKSKEDSYILHIPDNQTKKLILVNKDNNYYFEIGENEVSQEQYMALIHERVWETTKNFDETKPWFDKPRVKIQ